MAAFRKMFPLIVVIMALLAINSDKACGADPDMLQDICVADFISPVKVNGFPCKNSSSPADFSSMVLSKPGVITNSVGSAVTVANVNQIPGLNTLGVSLARVDFAPGGVDPPHVHPRATEIIYLLNGQLDIGFITTDNKLFFKRIVQGEVFVFPRALIHFMKNNGKVPAAVISAFNSQLPGAQLVATALFAASPPVPNDVLARTFKITPLQVALIKTKFAAH